MVIIWGQRLCGKVDHVPGLFSVKTSFFHLQYVPLIPLGSYIVLEGAGDRGVATSLSFKSILVCWLRTALVVLIVATLIMGIVEGIKYFSHDPGSTFAGFATPTAWFLGGLCLYSFSVRFSRAGYHRALELGTQLGLEPEVIEQRFQG